MARDHQSLLNRTGAFRGQMTTDMVRQAQNTEIAQRDAELMNKAVSNVQEVADEEHNLTLTVAGDKPAPIIPEKEPIVAPEVKPVAVGLQFAAPKPNVAG